MNSYRIIEYVVYQPACYVLYLVTKEEGRTSNDNDTKETDKPTYRVQPLTTLTKQKEGQDSCEDGRWNDNNKNNCSIISDFRYSNDFDIRSSNFKRFFPITYRLMG